MFSNTRSKSAVTSERHRDLTGLRKHLVRAAAARQTQLLNLRPVNASDLVAVEYQASVRRIYDDIHAALDRIDAGTYGDCTRCGAAIPLLRLADRPWVTQCEPCATRPL